ncbi:DMT family transporter [Roseobacter ponti]|uniref:DMT family transporter n=1 Tax=Roseobacter ponti TaxID=1891787 RepID=A0A858SQF0_9RHOB|nr:DMT family transporter [Roseobacter ponti]QJF50984.1 DMT family transporter [Roseobacter ponti]
MDNLRGAALMVLAMIGFALEDMLIKFMAADLPVGQIVGMLGLGSALVLAPVLILRREPLFSRDMMTLPIALRALGELVGTIGFVTAIALIPLSTASAILQANPLVVTLGAALFLKEAVGWRRWSAILVGFCGVLMIIRPGFDGFSWESLFAVQGVFGLALRDLATRRVPPRTSSLQLSFLAFIVLIPTAAIMLILGDTPMVPVSPQNAVWLGLALMIGIVGYYAIVAAMRVGEVSFVTPFRYSRILFALMIGVGVFGEEPDAMTLTGAAVIVASGLYTLWRERNVRANSG